MTCNPQPAGDKLFCWESVVNAQCRPTTLQLDITRQQVFYDIEILLGARSSISCQCSTSVVVVDRSWWRK